MDQVNASSKNTADWSLYGTVQIQGDDREVWRYEDADGRGVFQMTTGGEPHGRGGYHELESLLRLKNARTADLHLEEERPATTSALRP